MIKNNKIFERMSKNNLWNVRVETKPENKVNVNMDLFTCISRIKINFIIPFPLETIKFVYKIRGRILYTK